MKKQEKILLVIFIAVTILAIALKDNYDNNNPKKENSKIYYKNEVKH